MTLEEAVDLIMDGVIIAYPTETVYGLGGRVDDSIAREIYRIKGRPEDLPLPVAVSTFEMIEEIAHIRHENLIRRYLPGPFAFVLPSKKGGTVAVRIPDSYIALQLIDRTGPIYSTSANRHGERPPTSWDEVKLDVPVLKGPPCRYGMPSTVVDLTSEPVVLRKGPVPFNP